MMKYRFDVLPTKSELATRKNNSDIAIFVQPGEIIFCWSHFYPQPRP